MEKVASKYEKEKEKLMKEEIYSTKRVKQSKIKPSFSFIVPNQKIFLRLTRICVDF